MCWQLFTKEVFLTRNRHRMLIVMILKRIPGKKLAGLPAGRRRAGAGAADYQGKLYLVDGIQHGHSSGTTNMFDVYDPKTNTWTALPDAPHIRDHSQAVVIKDKLYAVGGRNTSYRDSTGMMFFFQQDDA